MPSAKGLAKGVSEALAAALVLGAVIAVLLPALLALPTILRPEPPSRSAKTLFLQEASGYAAQNTFSAYAVLSNVSGSLTLRIVIDSQRGVTVDHVYLFKPPYLIELGTNARLPTKVVPGVENVIEVNVSKYSSLLSKGVATLIIQSSDGAVIRLPIVPTTMLQSLATSYTSSTNLSQSYAYQIFSGATTELSNENLSQSLSQIFYIGNVTNNYELINVPTYGNPGVGMRSTYPMVLTYDLSNVLVWTGKYVSVWWGWGGYKAVMPMNANILFVGKSGDGIDMVINMVNFGYSDLGISPQYYLGYCTADGNCGYLDIYYLCPAGARIKIIGFEPAKPTWDVWLYASLNQPLGSFIYAKCWNDYCVATNASGTYVYIIPPLGSSDYWTYYGSMDSFLFYGYAKEVRIYCKVYQNDVSNGETSYEPYVFVGNFGLGYGIWFLTMDDSLGWYDDPNDVLKYGYYYTYDVEDGSTKPLVLIAKSPVINNSVVRAVDISLILAFMDNAGDDAGDTTDNGSRPYVIVGLVDADTGKIVTEVPIPFSVLTRVEDTYPPCIGTYSATFFIPVPPPSAVGQKLYLPFVAIQDPYFKDAYDNANDVDVILGILYFGVILYGR